MIGVDVAAKFLTFTGTALMLGGGVLVFWVPEVLGVAERRRLALSAALGGLMVILGAVLEVSGVVLRIAGGAFEWDLLQLYLSATRHGRLSGGRVLLALGLSILFLVGWWRMAPHPTSVFTVAAGRSALRRGLFAVGTLLFLGLSAALGHSGAMGLAGTLLSLTHYVALVAWGGTLVAVVLLADSLTGVRLAVAVNFVSRVGPPMVALLLLSGVAMARLHLNPPTAIVSSAYGAALLVKLALVALTLISAAYNRWVRLPRIPAVGVNPPMRRALRLEVALILTVLAATAVLATRPPVHP